VYATRNIKQILNYIWAGTIGIGTQMQRTIAFVAASADQVGWNVIFGGNGSTRPSPPFLEAAVVERVTITEQEALAVVFTQAGTAQVFASTTIVLGRYSNKSAKKDAQKGKEMFSHA
jgi:hypothetical protein